MCGHWASRAGERATRHAPAHVLGPPSPPPGSCSAVRTLLGIDPSPGAMFGEDAESPAAADPRSRTSNSRNLRAETSIALAAAAGASGGSSGGGGPEREDALEEARLAGEAPLHGSWVLCWAAGSHSRWP